MAIHSSILAWRIPWMEEPGAPQSMWSQRVRHVNKSEQYVNCLTIKTQRLSSAHFYSIKLNIILQLLAQSFKKI